MGGGRALSQRARLASPSRAADQATALLADKTSKNGAMPLKIQVKLRGDAPDLFRGKIGPQFSGLSPENCAFATFQILTIQQMVRF